MDHGRQRVRDGRLTGYGLGLTLGERDGRREAWHTGGQERVSTVLYTRPDSGVVVVLLSNLEGVGTPLLQLARRIADIHPGCAVHEVEEFVAPANWPALLPVPMDVVIDACDQVRAKEAMAA